MTDKELRDAWERWFALHADPSEPGLIYGSVTRKPEPERKGE
jgi:hypothetical protein